MSTLACLGGAPVKAALSPYHAWPTAGESEREAMRRVLHSGTWGTIGPESVAFGREFADYCQAEFGLAVINGTVSLELILRALEIGRGDEVIVPPYTFSATIHSVCLAGAMPVFADTDTETYTLSPASVEAHITDRTRAIIAVHLGGRPCDMDALLAIAQKHDLPLIEDAAHAHGSEWRNQRIGSLGTAGSFSFQASKNISCGEGGFITTRNEALYRKIWKIHNSGRDLAEATDPVISTNARLAEWQCALLRARMLRLDGDIEKRMENAAYLDREMAEFPFLKPLKADERITRNGLHLYVFRYLQENLGISRELFLKALAAENVTQAGPGYCEPLYDAAFLYSPAFEKMTGRKFANPKAELPGNERCAHLEGCWMYHSSLLGERSDMDAMLEAFEKIARHADELRKEERQ